MPECQLDPYLGRRLLSGIDRTDPDAGELLACDEHRIRILWIFSFLFDGDTLDIESLHASLKCMIQGQQR